MLDIGSSTVIDDPFPVYERIRAAGRCVHDAVLGVRLVTGFDDASTVLLDTTTFSSALMSGDVFGPWYRGAATMLGADPPDHARLRSVVRPSFAGRAVAALEATVAQIARRLVDDVAAPLRDGAAVDVVGALAEPLPIRVVATMLGLPASRDAQLARWTADMARGSVAAAGGGPAQDYERAVASGEELARHVEEHLATAGSSSGLLGALLGAEEDGRSTRPESVAAGVLLLLAGTETVAKALGNAVELLGRHPHQRDAVLDDPSLLPGAVEEVLRFCGPAQFDPRLVTTETRLAGVTLHPGDVVWVLEAAANRDPSRFEQPHRFDVRRRPRPHLSFGSGPHLCVGAGLARSELRAALAELLRVTPRFELDHVRRGGSLFVRGPDELWIRGG